MITRSLLQPLRRSREFRSLFLGLVCSRTGDTFNVVAITIIALTIAGPQELGLLLLIGSLPLLVASPVAGAIVDRFGVRTPVRIDNGLRAILTGALALLAFADAIRIEYLYVYMALQSAIGATSDVGFEVAVPALVDDEELESAHTLMSVVWDVSALLGPASAGLLVAGVGPGHALLVDAASFALVGLLARHLPSTIDRKPAEHDERIRGDETEAQDQPTSALRAHLTPIVRGYGILRSNRPLGVLTLTSVVVLTTGGALEVVYPVLITEELELGASQYGLLVSIAGLCSLLGTTFLTPVFRRWRTSRSLALAIALRGLLLAPMALSRNFGSATAWASASTTFDGPFYPLSRAQSQRLTPRADLGAVTGARTSLGVAGYPLGSVVAGFALASFGSSWVIVAIAAAHLPLIALLLGVAGIDRHEPDAKTDGSVPEQEDVA